MLARGDEPTWPPCGTMLAQTTEMVSGSQARSPGLDGSSYGSPVRAQDNSKDNFWIGSDRSFNAEPSLALVGILPPFVGRGALGLAQCHARGAAHPLSTANCQHFKEHASSSGPHKMRTTTVVNCQLPTFQRARIQLRTTQDENYTRCQLPIANCQLFTIVPSSQTLPSNMAPCISPTAEAGLA